jgi:hypothetical protein
MSDRTVEVRIDELALDGVSPVDRDRVADSVTRELERLLDGAAGRIDGPGTAVAINAGEVAPVGRDPDALGAAIARAIHGQLVR